MDNEILENTYEFDYRDNSYDKLYFEVADFILDNFVAEKDNKGEIKCIFPNREFVYNLDSSSKSDFGMPFTLSELKICIGAFYKPTGEIFNASCSLIYKEREDDTYLFSFVKNQNGEYVLSIMSDDQNSLCRKTYVASKKNYEDDSLNSDYVNFTKLKRNTEKKD